MAILVDRRSLLATELALWAIKWQVCRPRVALGGPGTILVDRVAVVGGPCTVKGDQVSVWAAQGRLFATELALWAKKSRPRTDVGDQWTLLGDRVGILGDQVANLVDPGSMWAAQERFE